jgi:hypothetical protein
MTQVPALDPRRRAFADIHGRLLADHVWAEITSDNSTAQHKEKWERRAIVTPSAPGDRLAHDATRGDPFQASPAVQSQKPDEGRAASGAR